MRGKILLIMLAASVFAPFQALAGAVLYSNIGPGFAGDTTEGWESGDAYFGTAFTTTAGGTLSEIIIGAGSDVITMDTAGLYADSGGEPGAPLESWNVMLPYGTGNSETLISMLNPVLSADTQYWFVFGPGSETVEWVGNDTNVVGSPWSGPTLTTLSGGDSSDPTDFSLGIELLAESSVPEPSTGSMIAVACVALVTFRRIRSKIFSREAHIEK